MTRISDTKFKTLVSLITEGWKETGYHALYNKTGGYLGLYFSYKISGSCFSDEYTSKSSKFQHFQGFAEENFGISDFKVLTLAFSSLQPSLMDMRDINLLQAFYLRRQGHISHNKLRECFNEMVSPIVRPSSDSDFISFPITDWTHPKLYEFMDFSLTDLTPGIYISKETHKKLLISCMDQARIITEARTMIEPVMGKIYTLNGIRGFHLPFSTIDSFIDLYNDKPVSHIRDLLHAFLKSRGALYEIKTQNKTQERAILKKSFEFCSALYSSSANSSGITTRRGASYYYDDLARQLGDLTIERHEDAGNILYLSDVIATDPDDNLTFNPRQLTYQHYFASVDPVAPEYWDDS